MVATSGAKLINDEAIDALKSQLLPMATVLTPNIPEAEVLSGMKIETADDMIKAAAAIGEKYHCAVSIHMDPVADHDEQTIETKKIVTDVVKSIDQCLSIHDFRMTKGENRENLIFDVVVPFDFRLSDSEVKAKISKRLTEFDGRYNAVINVDKGDTL